MTSYSQNQIKYLQCLYSVLVDVRVLINEDTTLPEEHMHGADDYPVFLDLGMRDWNGRSEEFHGELYSIRAWRNRVDSRFCLVFWLMAWWSVTGYDGGGPIFQKMIGEK